MAATDRPFRYPYADTRIFFFLPHISLDILLARVARCVQKLRTIPLPTKLVKLQRARLFSELGGEASPRAIVVIHFVDFSDKMYAKLSDSDANIRDFETE